MDDESFIGNIYLQKCGDSLKILEKIRKEKIYSYGKRYSYVYKCIFLKYPCEIISEKKHILNGSCVNPEIEKINFINKIWPQHCGDSLRILEKSDKKDYWKCEFIKYPFKIEAQKINIINGAMNNPQIEQVEFIDKIWPQNCGDSLKIIEKTTQRLRKNGNFLYKARFIKSNKEVLSIKDKIIRGGVALPLTFEYIFNNKDNLKKYLKKYEEENKEKIDLVTLAKKLEIAPSTISHKINQFQLRDFISYSCTGIERNICEFIESFYKFPILKGSFKQLKNQEIDIYIPNKKLGIEFNGNLWHSNHFKFGKNNLNYHQEKSLLAKSKDINLIHIFEYEWNEKQEILKSLIKLKLGVFDKKIGARKCIVKELDYKTYAFFCNENHLQGECGAKVKFGLFYKDELVQIMSFGVPRFTNEYEWEILRECSKLGYIILGGKEKLWKYFLNKYFPNNCLSYCDFSKFTGDSYLKLGFKKERLNNPGFVWWDFQCNQIYWRNPYKNQEMKEKGYFKIYDCGQLVFSWHKV